MNPKGTARASFALTLLVGCTSILGLLVNIFTAKYFGISGEFDAYLTGAALPLTMTGLLLGSLTYVLIPMMSRGDLNVIVSRTFSALLLVDLAVLVTGLSASPYLLRATAPGLPPPELALAIWIQRVYWVSVFLAIISAFFAAIHNYHYHFLIPAFGTMTHPVFMIIAMIIWHQQLGVKVIALSFLASCICQCGILWMLLPGNVVRFGQWPGRIGQRFLVDLGAVIVSLMPNTLLPAIDAFWAATMAVGSLSFANYGFRLSAAGAAVLINGVATVLFPAMAEDAKKGNSGKIYLAIHRTLLCAYLVLLPLILLAIPLYPSILKLLLEHGSFNHSDTTRLAHLVPYYFVGMLGMGAMNIVGRALYAFQRFRFLSILGALFVIVYFAVSGLMTKHFSYYGFGIGYCLCWTGSLLAATLYLFRILKAQRSVEGQAVAEPGPCPVELC